MTTAQYVLALALAWPFMVVGLMLCMKTPWYAEREQDVVIF